MTKILLKNAIITDVHLKDREKDYMKEKRISRLEESIDKIIKDKVKRVFFLGDIFDQSNISTLSESFIIFNNLLSKLIKEKIEIYIVVGNHEKQGGRDIYTFMTENIRNNLIHIYNNVDSVELDDFNAIFVPFLYPKEKGVKTITALNDIVSTEVKNLANSFDNEKPVILFNHNVMNDVWFYTGDEMKVLFQNFKELDYSFGGHIHAREFLKNEKGVVKGMYVGSFIRSFVYDEETEGYVTFDIDNDKKVNVQVEDVKSYNYEKVVVTDYKTLVNDFKVKEGTLYDIKIDLEVKLINESNINNNEINGNVRYNIEDFFIERGGIIKNITVKQTEQLDENEKKGNLININTDKVTILKGFLKRDKIPRKEREGYIEKLDKCIGLTNNLLKDKDNKEVKKENEKLNKKVKVSNDLTEFLNNEIG